MKSLESCFFSPVTSSLHHPPTPIPTHTHTHSAFCLSDDMLCKRVSLQHPPTPVTSCSPLCGKAYGQGDDHTCGTASVMRDGDVMWQVIRWGTWCVWECLCMCECIHVCPWETERGGEKEKEQEWERERETLRGHPLCEWAPLGIRAGCARAERPIDLPETGGTEGWTGRKDSPVCLSASTSITLTPPATLSQPMSQVTQIQEASSLIETHQDALLMTSYSRQQWHRLTHTTRIQYMHRNVPSYKFKHMHAYFQRHSQAQPNRGQALLAVSGNQQASHCLPLRAPQRHSQWKESTHLSLSLVLEAFMFHLQSSPFTDIE